jgi:hypothetical protein
MHVRTQIEAFHEPYSNSALTPALSPEERSTLAHSSFMVPMRGNKAVEAFDEQAARLNK